MPELPEVETIKRNLSRVIVGKRIKGVKILRKKSFQGKPREIIGKTITDVSRRAKLLIIELGKTDRRLKSASTIFLVVHLKLTGQIIYKPKTKNKKPHPKDGRPLDEKTQTEKFKNLNKYTRVMIEFGNGSKLLFNDLRVFGWMKIIESSKFKVQSSKFGAEPFSKEFTVEYLKKIFSKTKRAIKIVLMDQTKIAGIGNIYANEILYLSGIVPTKPSKRLRNKDIKKLREEILRVLKEAIKYKGSTAKDDHYKLPDGGKGAYQYYFRVYQRDGKKCRKCGTLIKRTKLGGRGTYFCTECQK